MTAEAGRWPTGSASSYWGEEPTYLLNWAAAVNVGSLLVH
jgi:hypothetical protein